MAEKNFRVRKGLTVGTTKQMLFDADLGKLTIGSDLTSRIDETTRDEALIHLITDNDDSDGDSVVSYDMIIERQMGDADSPNQGPVLALFSTNTAGSGSGGSSMLDDTNIGNILFRAETHNATDANFGQIRVNIQDSDNTSRDSKMFFKVQSNNSMTEMLTINGEDGNVVVSNGGLKIGSGAAVTTILDEDNMASDSATALATQQSIKAYVASQVGAAGGGDITGVDLTGGTGVTIGSETGTTTGNYSSTISIGQAVGTSDDVTFSTVTIASDLIHSGDTNNKITFGTDTQTFTTAGTARMTIASDGDVGIGTTSPAHNLDVASSSTPSIFIRNTDAAHAADDKIGSLLFFNAEDSTGGDGSRVGAGLRYVATDNFGRGRLELTAGNSNQISSYGDSENYDDTSIARLSILTDGGNVGIGTTSPLNKLQVDHTGADGDDGIMVVRADSSTASNDLLGGIGFDSTDGNVPSSVLEASAAIVAKAREDHGTGDKGGYLEFMFSPTNQDDDTTSSIGMTFIDGKLAVNNYGAHPSTSFTVYHQAGDFNDGMTIINRNTTISDGDLLGAIGFDSKDGNSPSQATEASAGIAAYAAEDHSTGDKGGDLIFFTSAINDDDDTASNERMRIDSEGNVGIGNTSPSTALDVTGSVTLTGLVLDGNTITGIDDSGEFTNDDAHIMTSAAVEDKILGYGYITSQMTFILEDDDGTEVSISDAEEIKFLSHDGSMTIDWTDIDSGSDGDPFDVDFRTAHAPYLYSQDDRDFAPEDLDSSKRQVFGLFSSKTGLEDGSTAGSDYVDALVLETYNGGSGGDANLLAFSKTSTQRIYHYRADQADTDWGTASTVAYISDIPTTEAIQDIVGAMFSSNTETNITVTYEDGDGTIDLVASGGSSGMSDLVDDTSPQLGGNLDTNSQNILIDDGHGIYDDSSNEQLLFGKTTSANSYIKIWNGISDTTAGTLFGTDVVHNSYNTAGAGRMTGPGFEATGDQTDVGMSFKAKGLGHFVFTNDDTTDAAAPVISLLRNTTDATVADDDNIGLIKFMGSDSSMLEVGSETAIHDFRDYARIGVLVPDQTSGNADGEMYFSILVKDSQRRLLAVGSNNLAHGDTPAAGVAAKAGQVRTFSGNQALDYDDYAGLYLIATSALTFTLPADPNRGEQYVIISDTTGTVTIARNGNTINGASSNATITTRYEAKTFIATSSSAYIMLG
tara:strand:+ start:3225 stop:6833 length:3609 start_codon:yes stop_codon:yes gene_type:complete